MKIKYFEVSDDYGWGCIFRQSIDTSHQNYISHSEDKIVLKDSWEDRYGEVRDGTRTFYIKFEDAWNELMNRHKKIVDELQKEISLLEQSKDEAVYFKKLK